MRKRTSRESFVEAYGIIVNVINEIEEDEKLKEDLERMHSKNLISSDDVEECLAGYSKRDEEYIEDLMNLRKHINRLTNVKNAKKCNRRKRINALLDLVSSEEYTSEDFDELMRLLEEEGADN